MINYILGQAGIGKTQYSLSQFGKLSAGVYFFFPVDEQLNFLSFDELISVKCLIDCSSCYRKYLDKKTEFEKKMYDKIKGATVLNSTIFLDEFQLYCSDRLVDLVLNTDFTDFYLIHQFPEQLKQGHFSKLYSSSKRKFLFDPYPSPRNYAV